MAQHNLLGSRGETLAREYLISEGYTIYDSNLRIGAEIDIIAIKDDMVAFVEVKTRSEPESDPLEAFPAAQRARVCRAADAFIRQFNIELEPRFDVILINVQPDGTFRLTHYPDAFLPPLNGGWR